jgi:tripartite motif-containing protein 71
MQGDRVSTGRRLRWLAIFTVLLLASSSVPVLAEPGEQTSPPPAESSEPVVSLPDASDVREGIEMAEAEAAERERWLESPEVVRQRKESRFAYADLTATQAQELLLVVFAEQLTKLNNDPARWLSDASIVRSLGESVATVSEDGDKSLLDAGMPVRAEDEDGNLRKVDLSLEETPYGFEPVNPLAELKIPDAADEAIEIGGRGLAVSAVGADGSREARLLGDKNVFYPEAQGAGADTDRLVSPTSGGVEIFDLLRSADSPEVMRYEMEMPDGAELRPDGNGGARVVKGGEVFASVPFPVAFDAQGTQVPVELKIEGNVIALHINHREADVSYPLLLDPHIWEDWVNNNWFNGHNTYALDIGAWQYTENWSWIEGETHCIYTCWGWRGLYVSMMNGNHNANEYGHWSYSGPTSTSYLVNAWAIPFWRDDHGCNKSQYPRPYDYVGMWNAQGYWNRFLTNEAINVGSVDIQSAGEAFVFGLSTGSGAPIPCWRDLGVGGVAIWLDDSQYPSLDSVSIGGTKNGWLSDLTTSSISVNARDEGLGVRLITMFPEGKSLLKHEVGCTGLAGNRCPTTRSWKQNFTGDSLGEGKRFVQVSAEDPVGKASGTYETHTWVDRSKPEVQLDGQLAEATEDDVSEEQGDKDVEKLRLPVYNLKIEAKDGDAAHPHTMRSGVEDIRVFLDGVEQEVPWSPKGSCPATSCSKTETYQLKLSKLNVAGTHKLKVIVVDFVGKEKERELEFEYFPATGMKDEYVMHYFPLPDGQGNEAEEEHPDRPELAVNVMNGNLVYREQDVEVEGPAVDLEVERYYNSMLPEAENTEWGDGWTLAQTPDLEPVDTGGSSAPDEAEMLESSGAIEEEVELPTETGEESFDPALRATLTKKASGGYELSDETGESATSVVFDEAGQTEAEVTDGFAKVDYSYEGGELSQIAVEDPGSAAYPESEPFEVVPSGPPVYAASFGSAGTGNGQFNQPADVAIAPDGDIWVADADNDRVQHFDSNGTYIGKFGSNGTGNGQFRKPIAIEVDEDGYVWVLDSMNERVQKFNDKGEYLTKWGSFGTANGKLDTPKGFTIDAEGNFWVSDTYNDRIQKFTKTGTFLKVTGTSGPGDLSDPMGIDLGPEGEVFVADWEQNRVVVFNAQGEYKDAFGSEGYGDGQFRHPVAIDVDTQGNVWVSDEQNERIERFDLQGNYVDQFGSEGSGNGQMELSTPMGITTDAKGGIWLTDSSNDRVQLWVLDDYRPVYGDSFGSAGTGNGQFDLPGDVAIAPDGDIWVADVENHRIQHFDPEGNYIGKFGSAGSGNGQFNRPRGIEFDASSNIWVLDSANHRLQKFNEAGEYLAKWGTYGGSNGQLKTPKGFTIDPDGNFWVADTINARIQKFSANGTFLKVTGTSGPGDLTEPIGIDTSPEGDVFVADWTQNRVVVFSGAGEYKDAFGTEGYGDGQFRRPSAVDVDPQGNVWVGDEMNERVEQFDLSGEYVTQFGIEGSDDGEMELTSPMGFATDADGDIWLTDSGNDRVQLWERPQAPPSEEELLDDDPEVQVEVANDLVTSVVGEEAGEHSYEHEGDFIVSHDGPQGETLYEEEGGLLTKVTLPNGTWTSIVYYSDRRVESVTVAPEGANAKTTYFYYQDAPPRRTVVDLPNDPNVTYDIGSDGSVFKSWNTEKPPEIEVAGTLWDFREEPGELWSGNHELHVEAESTEGIASIQVIANGNQLVDEATCEEDKKTPEVECEKEESLWVTHTNNHAPGDLYLEVLVTDQSENSTSERFWVDIPEPPPPPAPGTPVAPTFEEIAEFREEYGLEIVFPVKNETELAERINNLIGYWHNPNTPLGAVARASWERWGIPLRPEDAAELEYREWFYNLNAERIDQWVEAANPSSYAGYYIDHRAGGFMRIGFLANQAEELASLETSLSLVGGNRLSVYPTPPTVSYLEVRATAQSVLGAVESNSTLADLVVSVEDDEAGKATRVGTPHVAQVEGILDQMLGANAPVAVEYEAGGGALLAGRYRNEGRMRAGDYINSTPYFFEGIPTGGPCTAGFGAEERLPRSNGGEIVRLFLLTAGHCAVKTGEEVWRNTYDGDHEFPFEDAGKSEVGKIRRSAFQWIEPGDVRTDGAAIRTQGDIVPLAKWGWDGHGLPTKPPGKARKGNTVCYSGAISKNVSCGKIVARSLNHRGTDGEARFGLAGYWVRFPEGRRPVKGDSGSPVWNLRTGASIGLVSAGRPQDSFEETLVAPLLHPPNMPANRVPGILHHPGMAPLQLTLGG